MQAVDLVVCTGSQNNVRAAYSSGTPAIGVGAGNVPVIVDETRRPRRCRGGRSRAPRCFDNATSCSSENALVVDDAVYEEAIAALEREGGYLLLGGRERAGCRRRCGRTAGSAATLIAQEPR